MPGVLAWIEAHDGLAAWVQGVGSVAAIYWAGRTTVLQQRLAAEEAAEGIFGAISVASEVLSDAATDARDNNTSARVQYFDVGRYDDALRLLDSVGADARNLRLVELVASLKPVVRQSHSVMVRAVRLAQEQRDIGGNVWNDLYAFDQRAIGILAEAGRVLTRAHGRRKRWWLW